MQKFAFPLAATLLLTAHSADAACTPPSGAYAGAYAGNGLIPQLTTPGAVDTVVGEGPMSVSFAPGTATTVGAATIRGFNKTVSAPDASGFPKMGGVLGVSVGKLNAQTISTGNPSLTKNNVFYSKYCLGVATGSITFTFTPLGSSTSQSFTSTARFAYSVSNDGNVVNLTQFTTDYGVPGSAVRLEKQ